MIPSDRTGDLVTQLACATGMAELLPESDGGYHLIVGEGAGIDMSLYSDDDETLLLVCPVAPLPRSPDYRLAANLLRSNLYDSDTSPFQIALDDNGILVFWGRLTIDDFDGVLLAQLIDAVAGRVAELRSQVQRAEPVA